MCQGRTEAAAAVIQSMRGVFDNVNDTTVRAAAYGRQGKQSEARALVETSIQEYIRLRKFGVSCHAAEIYAVIGEKDLASNGSTRPIRSAILCSPM